MTPTRRSLELLAEMGYISQVVEHKIRGVNRLRDLFGCIDIVAIHPQHGILGVQATDGTNHSKRRAKALEEPRARVWVAAGGRLEVWSWSERGKRGQLKQWAVRIDKILFRDDATKGA